MAKKVGHYITRPGRNLGDPEITIPVAEDLETVPGIPTRERDVSFFSRVRTSWIATPMVVFC